MRKIVIIVTSVVVIIIMTVVILNLFPQVGVAAMVRYRWPKWKDPQLYVVPTSRTLKSFDFQGKDHHVFSYSGIDFKVPWGDMPKVESSTFAILLKFPNRNQGVVVRDDSDFYSSFPTNLLRGKNDDETGKLKSLFADYDFRSTFNFYKTIVSTSPNQITIFSTPKEAITKAIFIPIKSILIYATSTKNIYEFQAGDIRGFQLGDPLPNEFTDVLIFKEDGTVRDFSIRGTQEEIDFILSSMAQNK